MAGGTLRFGGLEVDVRAVPLYIIRYRDRYVPADVLGVLEWVAHAGAKHGNIAAIHDLRKIALPASAADRKRIVQRARELDAEASRYVAAIAVVTPSSLIHGAVTAGLWLFKPFYPIKVFRELHAATDWCTELLSEADALRHSSRPPAPVRQRAPIG